MNVLELETCPVDVKGRITYRWITVVKNIKSI